MFILKIIMEGSKMEHNDSIGCTVCECKHHDENSNHCTLGKINVTKHSTKADTREKTDCGSFEFKNY